MFSEHVYLTAVGNAAGRDRMHEYHGSETKRVQMGKKTPQTEFHRVTSQM